MVAELDVLCKFDEWTKRFAAFVDEKGKVKQVTYRAYGYKPTSHRWDELKLAWRDKLPRIGMPAAESSPAKQQELGLNKDKTLFPKEGEGEKLRD